MHCVAWSRPVAAAGSALLYFVQARNRNRICARKRMHKCLTVARAGQASDHLLALRPA